MAIKANGYSNRTRPMKKAKRRLEAEIRNEAWAELTPRQQLAELDRRGVRAKRQRQKIAAK